MKLRLRLPYLPCAECNTQLVNYLFVRLADSELICVFCATRNHDRVGDGAAVAALQAESEGFCEHAAPTLDQDAAVELLIAKGATPVR